MNDVNKGRAYHIYLVFNTLATGLDAVVAQGAEAGGHQSHFTKPAAGEIGTIGTVALVPEVVDAVRIPVIAAGGMADGRGLVGALALVLQWSLNYEAAKAAGTAPRRLS